jgi:hypothetical protein
MEDIIKETIESIKEYTPKLIDATTQITEYLQTENDFDALQLIIQVSEGIDWLMQAVNHIQNLKGVQIVDTEELASKLKEVNEALEARDFVLTADLFEYEINPLLHAILTKVSEVS